MKDQKQLQKPSNLKALDPKCHIQMKICSLQQQREAVFKLLGPVQPELFSASPAHSKRPHVSVHLLHTLMFILFSSKGSSSFGNSPFQAPGDREGFQAVTLGLLHKCTLGFDPHWLQDHSQCHREGMSGTVRGLSWVQILV